ncbi:MAG: peptidylprolyl isomerase [Xanthomonadales bacterium]|nr:peptidylprolyl isomerase [Xanthomonadales bacterium]
MQIADRCVVNFHYILSDENGAVLDSSRETEPLAYLHGAGNIIPGLEQALAGKREGDRFAVTVAPEQGYGRHDLALVQTVPRAVFQGVDRIERGMRFQAHGPQGRMDVVVTAVEGDRVTVDGNHPLADRTLHFDVEVVSVRAAEVEELKAGQAS